MPMQSIRFRHVVSPDKSSGVLVVVNGRRTLELGWKKSLEACQALDMQLRNVTKRSLSPVANVLSATGTGNWRGNGIRFKQEEVEGQVRIVVLAGRPERMLWDMPTEPARGGGPSIAREIWREWTRVTREAEEWDSREQVARDAAILHRSGAPIGLAANPVIRTEAGKIAQHDRDLRRFMTNGIRGDEVLAPPTVKVDDRTAAEVVRSRLPGMSRTDRIALMRALKGS